MKKSRFTDSQIVAVLKEGDAGVPVAQLVRKCGISTATYHTRRSKYAGIGVSDLKRMRELEAENSKLKRMYAPTWRSRTQRSRTSYFHSERRTNETLVAPHDPEANLYRKSHNAPAKLHYLGHVLMEHRTGLPIDIEVTEANGFAEREAALSMLDHLPKRARRTLAADKAYDTAEFVAAPRERNVTPHVAANDGRRGGSALDQRTTRHAGYRASQRLRKQVEEIFGWAKDGRSMRKMKVAGLAKVSFLASLTVGCYALLRVARLTAPPPLVST